MGILATLLQPKTKAHNVEAPGWMRATGPWDRFTLPSLDDAKDQADLYTKLSWIATAVGTVASTAAGTPFNVKQRTGEDTEDIPNHPFEMLLQRPNPLMSRFELLEATFSYRALTGNAYWWLNRPSPDQPPAEVWIIPAHQLQPIPDGRSFISGYEYDPGIGRTFVLEPWEVVHFKTFHPTNKYVGASLVQTLGVVGQGDIAMQKWNTNYFAKDNAKVPGFLAYADPVNDSDWEVMKEDLRRQFGGTKRGLMMLRNVGTGGVQWVQTSMSQKDMQFLDARTFNKEEIYGAIAPGLASVLAVNATEANAKAGKNTFLEFGIWPRHQAIAEKITNDLLPVYGDNLVGEFDDVRQVDRALELAEIERAGDVLTIDELRRQFYDADPIGDERGNLLVGEVGNVLGDAQLEYWRRRAVDVMSVVPQETAQDMPEEAGALPSSSGAETPETPTKAADRKAEELATLKRWAKKRENPDPADFRSDVLTRAEIADALGVPVKQATPEEYEDEIEDLIEQVQAGDMTEEDMVERLQELAAAAILLAFLRGSQKTETELTGADWQVIDEQVKLAMESGRDLARDIATGRYETTDPETGDMVMSGALAVRLDVWGAALLGAENLGMLNRQGDPLLRWEWTPGKDHCTTCVEMNGTVQRASEWRAGGILPQSRDLECGGWQCGCSLVEV